MDPTPTVSWWQWVRTRSPSSAVPPQRRRRPRLWRLVPVGAVLALFIGVPSLMAAGDKDHRCFTGALYATLRMFTLDGPLGGQPLGVEVARYLAAAVTLSTAVGAVASLFGPQWTRWRVRRWTRHVVVAGLGPEGRRLAEGFLARGRRVVGIDLASSGGQVAGLREHGALLIPGDARDPSVLAAAGVGRADVVVATAADDSVNAEIAVQVYRAQAAAVGARNGAPLRCFAHVSEPGLRASMSRHASLGKPGDRFELRLFSLATNAARLLVVDGLARELAARRGRDAPAHLVLVGCGDVGEAVLVETARMPRRPEPNALAVTALDAEAPARIAALLRRFPGLETLCALKGVATDRDPAALAQAVAAAERADPVSAVVIALPERGAAVAATLALRTWCAERGIPLYVWLREERGLEGLLRAGTAAVTVFGTADTAGSNEAVVDEALDVLARALHADYVEQQRAKGATPATNSSLVEWDALPETLRDANRSQADHVPVKLAAIGCAVAPADGAGAPHVFNPEEVESLAVLEHARWAADRYLDGWTYAPGPKDPVKRTSPHLVPWAALPETMREYDREPVRAIPAHLARLGLGVVRVSPPTRS